MATHVAFWLDYRGTDPWAETQVSFELHPSHGPPHAAHAWILERLRDGPLELFALLAADGAEILFCSATIIAVATWDQPAR